MNKLQRRVITALAAGGLLLNTVLPVFADTTIEISGNGSDSLNTADVVMETATAVVQSNEAYISNKVEASADTGGNTAKDNTGGDVSIDTGDAKVEVDVANTVNSNAAEVECCGPGDVDVLISGNGSDSDNHVDLALGNETEVFQANEAKIKNKVYADADTGDNTAKDNTGGDVSITTGDADVSVGIVNEANANYARISGDGSGSVSAMIVGNGSDSLNTIDLEILSMSLVDQFNYAKIENKVYAYADTGDNEAKDNTGGTVSIDTGDADVDVTVDNLVNFNWAEIDCDCLLDVLAKIAGNGSDSDNHITASIASGQEIFQDNVWSCKKPYGEWRWWWWFKKDCNYVDAYAGTGGNTAEYNTGEPGDDPSITTGDAEVDVEVENAGNANVVGGLPPLDWPDWPDLLGGFSLNITLDLSLLLALLGLA